MENKFDLDLDFNNEVSEVLRKERPKRSDAYQEAITYASKRNLGKDVVHKSMFEAMSSANGDNLEENASKACEAVYEEALQKYRTPNNPFPDEAAQAMNACREKYIQNNQNSGKGNFWNNVFDTINKVGDKVQSFNKNNRQQNSGGAQQQGGQGSINTPPPRDVDTDVRVLGMKPLVFVLVSLGVVAGSLVAIHHIGNSKGKK